MRRPSLPSARAGLVTAACVVLAATAPAAAVPVASPQSPWTRQYGGAGTDYALDVFASDQGTFVAGSTDSSMGAPNAGGWDGYLRKFRSDGSTAWTEQFGSTGEDLSYGVAGHGNDIYVAGTSQGPFADTTAPGFTSAFVRRYGTDGTYFWGQQFGTAEGDGVSAVDANAAGVVVGGLTWGALPGEVDRGDIDAFLRWSSRDAAQHWARQLGSDNVDAITGVSIAGSSIYVSGYTYGEIGSSQIGGQDAFVAKFTDNGSMLWLRQFGSEVSDAAFGVAASSAGVYVVGETWSALPGKTSLGWTDAFIRMYDTEGVEQWTRQFGSALHDVAGAVALRARSLYVTGSTEGAFVKPGAGGKDIFVQRLTLDGHPVWTRQSGSEGDEGGSGISATRAGVFVAANTTGDVARTARGPDALLRRYVSYRPDASIALAAAGGYGGNDTYNADGAGQRRSAEVGAGGHKSFFVRLQSDGDATDSFTVKGCTSTPAVRATYYDALTGGADVTDKVVAGTFTVAAVDPAAQRSLRVVLRALPGAPAGTVRGCLVTATSKNLASRVDAVRARLQIRP